MTRLVSVHGSIDPWMSIGVHSDINDEAPVIIVEGRMFLYLFKTNFNGLQHYHKLTRSSLIILFCFRFISAQFV